MEGVHIRAIAERCDLSAQTIYNLVGDKTAVMEQSATDWIAAIRVAAVRRSPHAEINSAFLMLEMFWDSALAHPAFVLHASRSSSTPRDAMHRVFYQAAMAGLQAELGKLTHEGALRRGVDVASLARQLTGASHVSICNWCATRRDVVSYARDLNIGPGAMLRAWLQGPELSKLERYSAAREQALSHWLELTKALPIQDQEQKC